MLKKIAAPFAWVVLGIVLSAGTAAAATGGTFVLGRSNTASGTTTLTSNRGTPLALHGPAAEPPFWIGANATRVPYLNSDLLDGLDSTALQRRLVGSCPGAIRAVAANGGLTCTDLPRQWVAVVDSDGSLSGGSDGVSSGHYLNSAGSFFVQLPDDVSDCAWIASSTGGRGTSATVAPITGQPAYVGVTTSNAGAGAYEPFRLLVTCP